MTLGCSPNKLIPSPAFTARAAADGGVGGVGRAIVSLGNLKRRGFFLQLFIQLLDFRRRHKAVPVCEKVVLFSHENRALSLGKGRSLVLESFADWILGGFGKMAGEVVLTQNVAKLAAGRIDAVTLCRIARLELGQIEGMVQLF